MVDRASVHSQLTAPNSGQVRAWTIVPSPEPGSIGGKLKDNSLDAVTTAGGSNLFAVGPRATRGPGRQTHPGPRHHTGMR